MELYDIADHILLDIYSGKTYCIEFMTSPIEESKGRLQRSSESHAVYDREIVTLSN